jgi:hypothetical protein
MGGDSSSMHFHPNTPGVVDPMQHHLDLVALEIFVDSAARTLPVPVIIDDQGPPDCETRIEMDELVPSRLVPVGVEPQNCDLARDRGRYRVLDLPLVKMTRSAGYPVLSTLRLTSSIGE